MRNSMLVIGMVVFAFAANAQEKKELQMATPAPASVTPSATPGANPNQGELKFQELEYNFGTIKQGESVDYEFSFTNVGKEPVIISGASGSCGCTVPVWPKEPIMKGEKKTIKVTFNSAGKMGMQDKTVTITSNAKTSPVVLHIKGNIEATTPPPPPPTKAKDGAPGEK